MTEEHDQLPWRSCNALELQGDEAGNVLALSGDEEGSVLALEGDQEISDPAPSYHEKRSKMDEVTNDGQ